MRPEKICRFGKSKGSADSDRAKFVGCAEGNFSCTMCGGPYGFARTRNHPFWRELPQLG